MNHPGTIYRDVRAKQRELPTSKGRRPEGRPPQRRLKTPDGPALQQGSVRNFP